MSSRENVFYPEYRVVCINCGNEKIIRDRQAVKGTVVVKCNECGARIPFSFERRAFRKRPYPAVRYGNSSLESNLFPSNGELLDISITGLRVGVKSEVPPEGTHLELLFALPPRGSRVRLEGEVIWNRITDAGRNEFGMRYSNINDHALKVIEIYLMD